MLKNNKGCALLELFILLVIIGIVVITVAGTIMSRTDSDIASKNLSKAADNFEVTRRVVFYNGITGEYILSVEGLCSVENLTNRLSVTCKTSKEEYKKHFLGLSDNVTYFAEQMDSVPVSVYHYRVTFKPQAILPDIDFRGDSGAIKDALTPDKSD